MYQAIVSTTMAVCAILLTPVPRFSVAAAETETHPPRAGCAIAIEVLIGEATDGLRNEHIEKLSGPSDIVGGLIRELESKSQLVVVDHIRLVTLQDRKALIQIGGAVPVATGRSRVGRGAATQTSYERQSVGTLISATARANGDVIIVELQIEKSHLERVDDDSEEDDQFVPSTTKNLTFEATLQIDSGKTILAGGIDRKTEANSLSKFMLVSARLLEPSLDSQNDVRTNAAKDRELRIFSLLHVSAKDAAILIRKVVEDAGQMRVGIESRTNSLLVNAETETLEVIQAILARLDEGDPRRPSSQTAKEHEESKTTSAVTKYDQMQKKELEQELKRLQKETLDAEGILQRAAEKERQAAEAYDSASGDEKAQALLRMLEAEAAIRAPRVRYNEVRTEFTNAKRAYLSLLHAE